MRTLVLNMFLILFILPFISGEMEKLTGTAMAGGKELTCTFTLVYNDLKMDLKKSKGLCNPRPKKTVKIPNYAIDGKEKLFTFTMKITKNGKITLSAAKIVHTTTPAPATTTPEPAVPCAIGFTLVCSSVSPKTVDTMAEVCPASEITGPARTASPDLMTMMRLDESCSCLPTRSVEQDLESGTSPLGTGQGCVKLEPELVFPNLKDNLAAVNITQMAIDWNISYIASSLTSSRTGKEDMEKALTDAMMKTINHELVFKSRGRVSRFVRSSYFSDIIAHNYMISQSLEATVNNFTARMSNPGTNSVQEACQQLNEKVLIDPECEAGCNASRPFRTTSGCCNNIAHKDFGKSNTAFIRLLPDAYTKNISLPRGGLNPSTLPNPRHVSLTVHGIQETQSKPAVSVMLMQFGQFLDHDITLTPEDDRDCCSSALESDLKMPEHLRFCFNIDTTDDQFYSGKTTCLPFTRSDAICMDKSKNREQFNSLTSYIDASNVYGSDTAKAQKLRSKKSGAMKTNKLGPSLPTRIQSGFEIKHGENYGDLVAGDERAIEQPGLASLHSLFLNEHNRLAELLKGKADDEEIYNIARKLVGAQMQNIVYEEFLPVVLGNPTMEKYNLTLPSDIEGDTVYNTSVDPSIANEFATVAFRFGHSLIPNLFLPSSTPIRSHNHCPLKENFFQFDEFVIGADMSGKAWQNLLIGMQYQQSPAMDSSISNSVIDFLYCTESCKLPKGFGQDLGARNIQRGRDHGLPSYLKFRELCQKTTPADWNSKPEDISENNWQNLKKAYENVDDIDPFTGGLSEDAVEDGLIGETFACILGLQFARLKEGDRFFFTHSANGDQYEHGLPKKVKAAIRNRKLGDIICDNTEANKTHALVMQIDQNEVDCDTRAGLTYSHIKELLSTESMVTDSTMTGATPTPSPTPFSTPSPSKTAILMTGGWDRRTQTTAEVFFPSTNTGCSVNSYALPRIVHTHTMNTFQKQTLICGGSPTRVCYEFSPASLDSLSTVWPKYANLTEGRYEHTSWVSSAGVVLIGGYAPISANAETTAEYVNGGNLPFTLPPTRDACAIGDASSDSFILTGGRFNQFKVTRYNLQGFVEHLPNLNRARTWHACGSFESAGQMVLIVAKDSTEKLVIGESRWSLASPLPRTISIATGLNMNNKFYILGGRGSSDIDISADIFEYDADQDTWKKVGGMQQARYRHAAAVIYGDFEDLCN